MVLKESLNIIKVSNIKLFDESVELKVRTEVFIINKENRSEKRM